MVKDFKFTPYFEGEVLRKRPYLKKEICVWVVNNPEKVSVEDNKRVRFWAKVKEHGDRYLRVVTLEDRKTIHNAFLDRGYRG